MQRRDLHVPGRNAALAEPRDHAERMRPSAPGRRADPPARARGKPQRRPAAPR
ncbi:MAG: hypothetical protein IT436_16695 [Phycisphaerales bacterium]|nr:hypothetical protein [Phycisphaerales bacterium]